MKNQPYELKRLEAAFERLIHLQNEITALAVKVRTDELDLEGITEAVHFVTLSGDLRQLVGRYQDLLDLPREQAEPGIVARCVAWACAQNGGAA